MENFKSPQFGSQNKAKGKKPQGTSTNQGYGYKGVRELLDIQLKQAKLDELNKKRRNGGFPVIN